MSMDFTPTSSHSANAVKRLKDRASYTSESLYAVLDAGLVAHVGFQVPLHPTDPLNNHQNQGSPDDDDTSESIESWPMVIPMAYARKENCIYLHGYVSGRLIKSLSNNTNNNLQNERAKATITVTHIDAIVMARSAFNHSFNYRSACVFGFPCAVTDEEEKLEALKLITNHAFRIRQSWKDEEEEGMLADRWSDCREVNAAELKSTTVVKVEIVSASVKSRSGPVKDDAKDVNVVESCFVGVLPIRQVFGPVEPAPYNTAPVPEYVKDLMHDE